MENKELTFGQKAVGITFNPSKIKNVDDIKDACANAIDLLDTERTNHWRWEAGRMLSIAITKIQEAQMRGVKAVTWDLDKKPSEEVMS